MKMRCVICKSKKFFMLCIKTKSSLFLLAYILFLVCCLLIYPVWDSATAQSIITGIAIAGACFSLADLFYCIQDMKNASVAKQQELYLMTIKVIRDGEERVKTLRSKVNTIKPADVQAENADVFEKGKDVIERLEKAITEMEPKTKETSIWGNFFTVTTIQDFYNWMASTSQYGRKNDLNADTIKRVGGFLGKIFRVAVEMGVVQSSPVKNALLKNPGKSAKHHKAIPSEEMDRIKKAIPSLSNERERLYMTLLAYTGMRPEEVLGMRWEHIHLENPNKAYCRVERTVTYTGRAKTTTISDSGKTINSIRTIPLTLPVVQILQAATCKEGYVLGRDTPLCYSTHQRTCNHAFKELGIKGKFSSYDFRTTYATELCEAGLTSKQVGDLMGHADTRMVETVYARSREAGVMQHLDFLNKLNSVYVN